MKPDEALQAVHDASRIRLRTGQGDTHAEGRMVSYSIVPTVHIRTDEGEQIHWRHDMAEVVPDAFPYGAALTTEKVREATRHIVEGGQDFTLDELRHEVITAIAVSRLTGADASLAALHLLRATEALEKQ